MASAPVRPWGNDRADVANTGPQFDYLTHEPQLANARGSTSNVVATPSGWAVEQEWAEETLVAMGGLNMTAPSILRIRDYSGTIGHTATEALTIELQLTKGVTIPANTANLWIVAISNDSNVANVNLLYSAADSTPEAGTLVFKATAVDLHLANTSPATKLTINSTSTFRGAANLYSRRAKTSQAITATISNANGVGNVVFTVT